MGKDIREMFERERNRLPSTLPEGHGDRFLQKLEQALPQEHKRRLLPIWLQVAAASVAIACLAWITYSILKSPTENIIEGNTIVDTTARPDSSTTSSKEFVEAPKPPENNQTGESKKPVKKNISPRKPNEKPNFTLADISPDLKKVEAFFISSINVELANLDVGPDEQDMVDAYMVKLKELGKEYEKLTKELNTIGINDMTITALIENLKLRLQLLQRLKKNLNHLKNEDHVKDQSSNI
jgi:hypothetical protein